LLKKPTIRSEVRDYLVDQIIRNDLQPGELLPPEGDIADHLGVSRGSVREAVRSLESLGIVEVKRPAGILLRETNLSPVLQLFSFLISRDTKHMHDLMRIREYLETGLIPELVAKVKDATLVKCGEILDDWERMITQGKMHIEYTRLFHRYLYEELENDLLVKLVDAFWMAFAEAKGSNNMRVFTIESDNLRREILEDHRKLLRAIGKRDVVAAKRYMFRHFRRMEAELKEFLRHRNNQSEVIGCYDFD